MVALVQSYPKIQGKLTKIVRRGNTLRPLNYLSGNKIKRSEYEETFGSEGSSS